MTVENGPYDHEQVESLDMAAKEGICFLTRVEGPMDGGGEQAFVYVEDGRILDDGSVELTLGPSIHDRVRFAADRETLR